MDVEVKHPLCLEIVTSQMASLFSSYFWFSELPI